jgi:uncharacterized protein (UPF0332 family)
MKLKWCKEQGLKFIQPNNNLAEEYYKSAEDTLRVANLIKNSGSNMWLATQKYYTLYLASYFLLMKIGIKIDIHSCVIEIIKLLENEKIINFNLSEILEINKELRIDNQYYLKNIPVDFDSKYLANILLKIKQILDNMAFDEINKIKSKVLLM